MVIILLSNLGPISKRRKSPSPRRPPPPRPPPTTTTAATPDYSFDYDAAYDDVFSDAIYPLRAEDDFVPPPPPTSCEGSISLHSKTYLRGTNETFVDTTPDVGSNIDNKLTSLEVRGDCCWRVYSEVGLTGTSQLFNPGVFNSASQMGPVFRAGSSIERIIDC